MTNRIKSRVPNEQTPLYELLAGNVIAYKAELAKALGSVNAGILIGQLLYWQGKGAKGKWTYKTIKDMENETGLSRAQQENAIKLCVSKKLLEVKLKGIPARRHFKIDTGRLKFYIVSLQEAGRLARPIPTDSVAENRQTNTENTNRENTNINNEGLKKLKDLKTRFKNSF